MKKRIWLAGETDVKRLKLCVVRTGLKAGLRRNPRTRR